LDDEESYERFRRRERREAVARDFTEVCSSTSIPDSYRPLVVEQRVIMVNWIIQVSESVSDCQCTINSIVCPYGTLIPSSRPTIYLRLCMECDRIYTV
jgi:hypothetical protein